MLFRSKCLVGTLAGLTPVKNLRRLVRAVASHDDKLQLVIVGEGPERGALRAEAAACGLSDLCLPGFMNAPWNFIGLFAQFPLSSDSGQFPLSLWEEMAAACPSVASLVGAAVDMVAPTN